MSKTRRKPGVSRGRDVGNRDTEARARRSETETRRYIALWKKVQPGLEAKVAKALSHGGYLSEAAARELAFHLTDWVVELHELNALFESARWNPAKAQEVLTAFVVHAPNHLAAAHRIMLGDPLTDVFELGAVRGSGRAKRKPGDPYREQARGVRRSERKRRD